MLYPLRQAAPDVEFIAANEAAHCRYMKMITLPKLRDALRDDVHEVKVPAEIAERAACRSSGWWRSRSRGRLTASGQAVLAQRREHVEAVLDRLAHDPHRPALSLELGRRVAVDVGRGAHLERVPQRPCLIDTLEPRHPLVRRGHEHDDVLGTALALRRRAVLVGDARAAEPGASRSATDR